MKTQGLKILRSHVELDSSTVCRCDKCALKPTCYLKLSMERMGVVEEVVITQCFQFRKGVRSERKNMESPANPGDKKRY